VSVPVVVAGNIDVRAEVVALLTARGVPVVATANVLPRIGRLEPHPAREAIREVFLRHVIGGKRLSRGPRFASLVRGATPDVVLTAVELLADHAGVDLVVVDVGGATTDVYSALTPDPAAPGTGAAGTGSAGPGVSADVAGTLWRARTVEGDLGLRWSAPGVVEAAVGERLLEPAAAEPLARAARARADDPAFLPANAADGAVDVRLAQLAAMVALRRHARALGGGLERDRGRGRDLGRVRLLIGSGGVLRHASRDAAAAALRGVLADHSGGWALPRAAGVAIDVDYVLAPAGLLAVAHPQAALALARRFVRDVDHGRLEHAERHAADRNITQRRG
jgi:uncharacterized protein (TIGR01319 family)